MPQNSRAILGASRQRVTLVAGLETGRICKILDVTVTNMGVLMQARTRLRECLEAKDLNRR
ncbi:MAG: hypothetical protein ACRD7E_05365, partial [Bryobacteraceae bacterium]